MAEILACCSFHLQIRILAPAGEGEIFAIGPRHSQNIFTEVLKLASQCLLNVNSVEQNTQQYFNFALVTASLWPETRDDIQNL